MQSPYVKELVEKCFVSVTHETHAPLCLNEGNPFCYIIAKVHIVL